MRLTSRRLSLLLVLSLSVESSLGAQAAPVTRAVTPHLALAFPWTEYDGKLWTRLSPTSGRSPAPFVSSIRVRFREALGAGLTFDYPLSDVWSLSASAAFAPLESELEFRGLSGDQSVVSTDGSMQRLELGVGRPVFSSNRGLILRAQVGVQLLRAHFDGTDPGFAHTVLSPGAVVGLRGAYPVSARGAIQLGAAVAVFRTDDEAVEEFVRGGSSVMFDVDPQTLTRVGLSVGYRVQL